MRSHTRMTLLLRVLWELIRYQLVFAMRGFGGVHKGLLSRVRRHERREVLESAVCRAVDTVCSIYWRRVLCLERSIVTARVMHAYGIAAEVVIGYRFSPFAGHAWVEVGGRVVNDSAGYAEK